MSDYNIQRSRLLAINPTSDVIYMKVKHSVYCTGASNVSIYLRVPDPTGSHVISFFEPTISVACLPL